MHLVPTDPWERRPDESAEEYVEFTEWLQSDPRPLPRNQPLALRRDWSTRAWAWDQNRSLESNPREQLRRTWSLVTAGVTLEAQKLLRDIQTSHGMVLSHREFLSALRVLAELPQLHEEDTEEADLSQLSDEDLEYLRTLEGKVRRRG